jgi:hypothetical protein
LRHKARPHHERKNVERGFLGGRRSHEHVERQRKEHHFSRHLDTTGKGSDATTQIQYKPIWKPALCTQYQYVCSNNVPYYSEICDTGKKASDFDD